MEAEQNNMDCLNIIKEKFDNTYNKLKNEDYDLLHHFCDYGSLAITSMVVFDESQSDYRVTVTGFLPNKARVIYQGQNESVAKQVFDNLIEVYDAEPMWIDKVGVVHI